MLATISRRPRFAHPVLHRLVVERSASSDANIRQSKARVGMASDRGACIGVSLVVVGGGGEVGEGSDDE